MVLEAPLKSAISLLFSSYLTLVLSSPPSSTSNSLANLAGTCILSPVLSGYNGLFLLGNDASDELARWGVLLAPSAIPCSLSPLFSRIHSSFFLNWKRTASSKFFDTQVSLICSKELVLSHHARYALSRRHYNKHSLLLSSCLFRIGRIENPSCSACRYSSQDISHLILHCRAMDSFAPLTFWGLSVSV